MQDQQKQQEQQKHLGYAKSYESSNQDDHDQLFWFTSNQHETILDDEFLVLVLREIGKLYKWKV